MTWWGWPCPLPFRTPAGRGGQTGLGPAPELLGPAFWPLEPLRGKTRALPRASLSGSFQAWMVRGHLALSWTATHSSSLPRGDLPKTSAARVGRALSKELSPHLRGLGSGLSAQGSILHHFGLWPLAIWVTPGHWASQQMPLVAKNASSEPLKCYPKPFPLENPRNHRASTPVLCKVLSRMHLLTVTFGKKS